MSSGTPPGNRVHGRADDRARIHHAVLVQIGVENPRFQRFAEFERYRGSAGADDHAREPLGMRCGSEQSGRGAHVRGEDVNAT
jgi:hypothetical protein